MRNRATIITTFAVSFTACGVGDPGGIDIERALGAHRPDQGEHRRGVHLTFASTGERVVSIEVREDAP